MRGEIVKTKSEKFKEFLGLYDKYPKYLVIKKVKISDELYYEFLSKAFKLKIEGYDPDEPYFKAYDKVPFSNDELDYGSIPFPKKYENSPIAKAEPTKLSRAVQLYKRVIINKTLKND